ncbi:MAG: Mut7-C RNAse domain-containing protein [Candidatus Methylomirabilales bacterium]
MNEADVRFIADSMLGKLAKWLRILGYDTLYFRDGEDGRLLAVARREGRILLTRDTRLIRRRRLCSMLFIHHDRVWDQLRQVAAELRLKMGERLGSRCLRCNRSLAPLAKDQAAGRVPAYVFRHHEVFFHCGGCGRIFWAGTHLRQMEETVRTLCG